MSKRKPTEPSKDQAVEEIAGLVDARILKREIQEEALRKGLIPYIPERPQTLKEDDEDEVE